jgi:hypothetical protein
MPTFERLHLVVMISDAEPDLMPWPVDTTVAQWSFLPLSGDTTPTQTGLVIRELALETGVNEEDTPAAVLRNLLNVDFDVLSLPGGVRIVATDGTTVDPGDGAGLEDWRDWLSYHADVFDVWMGEEPAPFVEKLPNGDVLVWQAWSEDADPTTDAITIPAAAVMPALHQLDTDLRAFRDVLEAWATDLTGDRQLAQSIRVQFDEAF